MTMLVLPASLVGSSVGTAVVVAACSDDTVGISVLTSLVIMDGMPEVISVASSAGAMDGVSGKVRSTGGVETVYSTGAMVGTSLSASKRQSSSS